jgi:hypothetical protein
LLVAVSVYWLRWAFAFLLEVAAARLFLPSAGGRALPRDGFAAGEVGKDRLLADEWLLAGSEKNGDRVGAGALAQHEVVDAEFGRPLPDAA